MGDPEFLIPKLITEYKCNSLYINRDYEKYAKIEIKQSLKFYQIKRSQPSHLKIKFYLKMMKF